MSQSATFYPVDSNDFATIEQDPNNLDLLKAINNYVCFQGTHEGLRFVLSKGLSDQDANLVNEIFYPTTYVGEVTQTVFPTDEEAKEFVDVTDDEEYDDFDREPVCYHRPEKTKQIAFLLNSITTNDFLAQFNPDELNSENIYPGCWSSRKDIHAYNENAILDDFNKLKELFNRVSETNRFLLCFVG